MMMTCIYIYILIIWLYHDYSTIPSSFRWFQTKSTVAHSTTGEAAGHLLVKFSMNADPQVPGKWINRQGTIGVRERSREDRQWVAKWIRGRWDSGWLWWVDKSGHSMRMVVGVFLSIRVNDEWICLKAMGRNGIKGWYHASRIIPNRDLAWWYGIL